MLVRVTFTTKNMSCSNAVSVVYPKAQLQKLACRNLETKMGKIPPWTPSCKEGPSSTKPGKQKEHMEWIKNFEHCLWGWSAVGTALPWLTTASFCAELGIPWWQSRGTESREKVSSAHVTGDVKEFTRAFDLNFSNFFLWWCSWRGKDAYSLDA